MRPETSSFWTAQFEMVNNIKIMMQYELSSTDERNKVISFCHTDNGDNLNCYKFSLTELHTKIISI